MSGSWVSMPSWLTGGRSAPDCGILFSLNTVLWTLPSWHVTRDSVSTAIRRPSYLSVGLGVTNEYRRHPLDAARLGFVPDSVIKELGWDDDVDEDLRVAIEKTTDNHIVDGDFGDVRSEEHTSELQSRGNLVSRL